MNKKILMVFVLGSIPFFSSCANPPKLKEPEAKFNTHDELSVFHKIAENDLGLSLRFPGYIVGIEKSYKKDLGINGWQFLNLCSYDDVDGLVESDFNSTKNFNKVEGYLDDCKRSYISHAKRYSLIKNDSNIPYIKEDGMNIPSVYDKNFTVTPAYPTVYKKSEEALSLLKIQIKEDINLAKEKDQPYTHIFLYSMGWNTDQQESFRNFNSLMTQLIENKRNEKNFKPLFIGISWPSEWSWSYFEGFGKLLSYPTKTDDADEIGFLWGSQVLRDILVPLKHDNKIPLIVIGHSFGARLLSRAVFAPVMSGGTPPKSSDIDLFVGLQGAFSVNRFIRNKGCEGYPYEDYKNHARKFIFTWSEHDSANPIASWVTGAEHIGGSAGYNKSTKYSNIFEQFTVEVQTDANNNTVTDNNYDIVFDRVDGSSNWVSSFNTPNKISIIDSSNLIYHNPYGKGGNAHSDIYTPGVAQLIWSAIDNL